MKLCKKSFLLLVGLVTISMDEITKAVEDATKAVDKENQEEKRNANKGIS